MSSQTTRALFSFRRDVTVLFSGGAAIGIGLLALWATSGLGAPLNLCITSAALTLVFLVLTVLSVLELLEGSSDPTGGTLLLIHEVIGNPLGFLVGNVMLLGSLALMAAFSLLAAQHMAALTTDWLSVPASALAAATIVVLVSLRLLFVQPGRLLLWPVMTVVVVTVFFVLLRSANDPISYSTTTTSTRLALWLSTIYVCLEWILTNRRWQLGSNSHLRWPLAVAGSLVLLGAILVMIQSPRTGSYSTSLGFASLLRSTGQDPSVLSLLIALLALLFALERAIEITTHTLYILVYVGGLPRALVRLPHWAKTSPWLLGFSAIVAALLSSFFHLRVLAILASACWFVPPVILNVAAIYSGRAEPDRRRPFKLPFYPVFPTFALICGLVIASGFPIEAWVIIAGVSVASMAVYFTYIRAHQAEMRIGESVFTSERVPQKTAGVFRILIPMRFVSPEERDRVLPLTRTLAHFHNVDVILLQVIPTPDPLASIEERGIAKEQDQLLRWALSPYAQPVRTYTVTRISRTVPEGILDTAAEEECDLILLTWRVKEAGRPIGRVLDPVIRWAPCDVAVITHRGAGTPPHSDSIRKILIPTAGGPHTPLAIRLALQLTAESTGTISVVYVTKPGVSEGELAEGQTHIANTTKAIEQEAERLELQNVRVVGEVVTAGSIPEGIAHAAEGQDIVIMGASEESLLDQVLFGNLPEQTARISPTPVLIVKRYRGLPRFWLSRAWQALFANLPTISVENRLDAYRDIRRGARPDVDFFIMMGLSTIIAAFGLLQNSGAVIIGAMLVAPLLIPMVAISLGISLGDGRLLRVAAEAAIKGVSLAIGLAYLLGLGFPARAFTEELLARTHPNLLDLGVALASGAAGAYALARKEVSSSLPGVAIAAALVPPLATVGLSLSWSQWGQAGGSLLLFFTNLTAIALAGAVVFILLGFRPAHTEERRSRLLRGLVFVGLSFLLIALPLGWVSVRSANALRVRQVVEGTLQQELARDTDIQLVQIAIESTVNELQVTATVYASREPSAADIAQFQDALVKSLQRPVRLRLIVLRVLESLTTE